jgi:integrase
LALLMMLRRMKRGDITAHGFRSTFSDWASEVSLFSGELRETALAHTIQNKAERAYRRGDALEKRRELMETWADWCA